MLVSRIRTTGRKQRGAFSSFRPLAVERRKRAPYPLGIACALLIGCQSAPEDIKLEPRDPPQSMAEIELVRTTFNALQPQSIARNREYCGYILRASDGTLSATEPRRGRATRCAPRWPGRKADVVASYHTHAAFDPRYDSEVPSYDDMASDILEGIDGYVATPGGRIWYINSARKEARLVCGRNCVIKDPDYDPADTGRLRDRYSLDDLAARQK